MIRISVRVVFVVVVVVVMAGPLVHQFAAAQAPSEAVKVSVEAVVEDGEKLILATVTDRQEPVEGATVGFFVKRTFGHLLLGTDQTLDDGTAAVPFPEGLAGDETGGLRVVAKVLDPPDYAGARGQTTLVGGQPSGAEQQPMPRALWARRAPVPLIVTVLVLFGGVWLTYLYVVLQIICIQRGEC